MSTEQAVVLAEIDRLQGTIDQRKKTITEAQNASLIHQPAHIQSRPQFASSSKSTSLTPQLHDVSSHSSRPVVPLVTKTSWKLVPSSNLTYNPRARSMGSKKLILNKATAVPAQTIPQSNHSRAIPIKAPTSAVLPSSTSNLSLSTLPQSTSALKNEIPQPGNNSSSYPTIPIQDEPILPSSQAPAVQTTSTLKSTTLSASSKPFVPKPSKSFVSSSKAIISNSTQSLLSHSNREVIIDGIAFARDPRGKKLVRSTNSVEISNKPSIDVPSAVSELVPQASTSTSTPLKASIAGTTYVRTKSGNLIALSALKKHQSQKVQEAKKARLMMLMNGLSTKYTTQVPRRHPAWDTRMGRGRGSMTMKIARPPRMKKNEQCRFFAKTGACRKGLTCVYQHEPSNVAICSRFLRRKCAHPASSCPLSHKPDAHNMEHCSHFPRCNKPDCPYPHVSTHTSTVCKDFAELGWCSKGAECKDRHVRECPEFTKDGTCSNSTCRLPHVINRGKKLNDQAPEESDSDEEGLQSGGDLFFTDVKGKRKANDLEDQNTRGSEPRRAKASKGHSPTAKSDKTSQHKRSKYDQVANNEDFVTFALSDDGEDQSQLGSGETDENKEEVASSVDSEELNSVMMDEALEAELESMISPPDDHLSEEAAIHPVPNPIWTSIRKIRRRADLEEGEEVEEGEIFDEEEEEEEAEAEAEAEEAEEEPMMSSEDEDEGEGIERQLLGDRKPWR
ncbi:hypothetical protein DFH28DRAFT_1123157 [Melampsora americana]|nr:hypothetical protein DFH28DRAFT_1123157 [Melampsora americana]